MVCVYIGLKRSRLAQFDLFSFFLAGLYFYCTRIADASREYAPGPKACGAIIKDENRELIDGLQAKGYAILTVGLCCVKSRFRVDSVSSTDVLVADGEVVGSAATLQSVTAN